MPKEGIPSKGSITIKKLNGKKLNKKKTIKVYVIAYNGATRLAKTIMVHVAGPKSKYTNAKKIELKKNSYTLKKGKSVKASPKLVLEDSKKKSLPKAHVAKLRYMTSDKNIATVNSKGKIPAKGEGSCDIYVYAANGKKAKISVTVK